MSKEQRIFRLYPDIYKPGNNPLVTALLRTWAQEDDAICTQLTEAKNQLFVSLANYYFLDKLGSNVGISRPDIFPTQDSVYRQMIPTLSYSPKQVRKTFYDLFDIFWGEEYSRSTITSQHWEPFSIYDENTLIVKVDGTEYNIHFFTDDFVDNMAATVDEVLAKINSYGYPIIAKKYTNLDNKHFVRLSTKTVGPTGTIEIVDPSVPPNLLAYTVAQNATIVAPARPFVTNGTAAGTFTVGDISGLSEKMAVEVGDNNTPARRLFIRYINGAAAPYTITLATSLGGEANYALGFFADRQIQHTLCSVHEINPNEIVVRIPNSIPLELSINSAHYLHEDSTIYNTDPYWPGGFLYDSITSTTTYHVSSISSLIAQDIVASTAINLLSVLDSSDFPNAEGYLIFDFGLENQEELVPYNKVLSDTSIIMNSSYSFLNDHSIGGTVNLCYRGQVLPSPDGEDYAIYINNVNVSEELMLDLFYYIKAAGVVLRFVTEDLIVSSIEFGPVITPKWLGEALYTELQVLVLVSTFGVADAGKTWFNITTRQFEGWNGTNRVVRG